MSHRFTLDVSVPGVVRDRTGAIVDAHAASLVKCSRCGVIEARVRVEVLGEVTYIIARGTDPGDLREGAHTTCGGCAMSLALARRALSGAPVSARREPVTSTRLPVAPWRAHAATYPIIWQHSSACTCADCRGGAR